MEVTHNNMLPGILTKEVEFFKVSETEVMAIHDSGIKSFRNLPAWIYEIVQRGMNNASATMDEMEAWVADHFGGLDPYADITINGEIGRPEYIDTQKSFDLGNGSHLTSSELRVLKLIQLPNKLIADTLFLSVTTVESHWQNIRIKTGLLNKPELTHFATRNGII